MTQPWQIIDTAQTSEGQLTLLRRGSRDFIIKLGSQILMNSALCLSEKLLAHSACQKFEKVEAPRILLAGLGLGFTLQAALEVLPPKAQVVVCELNPAVVRWCEGPLAESIRHAATDPRVEIQILDVAQAIAAAAHGPGSQRFDVVILDLYEGPHEDNPSRTAPFFGREALVRTRQALKEGGVLAIWSEAAYPIFEKRLLSLGFLFERLTARSGPRHVVYLASSRSQKSSGRG